MMAYDCALTKDLGTKSEEDLLSIQKKLDETYTLRKGDVEKFKLTKSNLIKRLDETITKMKFSFKNLLLLEECKVLMTKLERAQSKLDLPPLEKEVDRIECLVETTIQSKMVRKPLSPVLPQAVGYLSSDGMSYPGSLVQMLPATAISPFAPAYSNHAQSMKTSAKINNSATIQVPDDPSFRSNFG
jgi:hypothetical protein